jgi:CAAX prenyl protease-like protein
LDKEYLGLSEMLSSGRVAFNPFEELKDDPAWLRQFLAMRFLGLVVIVPIVEEFFIRGFLIRYVDDPDWDEIPLGEAKTAGWLSPTIYGLVAHMTEPLAAIAWFSLVTWMYKRTKSIWDCVIAHAITNLLLGLYIVKFEQWHLW